MMFRLKRITNKVMRVAVGTFVFSFLFGNLHLMSGQETGNLPTRDQIETKYKWNLLDIYETEDLWEADFKWVDENISKYSEFEGKLGNSSEDLFKCFKFDEEMGIKFSRLSLYANLAGDLDLSNSRYQAMSDRMSALGSKYAAATSFINPEILTIPEDKLWKYVDENEGLKIYKHALEDLLRTKKHTLPKEQEELLALSGPTRGIPYNVFQIFTDADFPFPKVKDSEGNDLQVSHGRYYAALYSTDRVFRENVYKGFYEPFKKFKNTLVTLFNGNIKSSIFNAKARKYNSTLEAALTPNNVPISVYDNLITTINDNFSALHRWCALKKKILGVDNMHAYDTYVTLFPSVQKEYTYEEAVEIVFKALKPLGEEYLTVLRTAFDNRWIDVFETQSKRSGAYSSGVSYGVHPYVLLNWNNQLNDIFTLAHEMGHNMHSYFTEKNQPYPYANYSIFVAEVASTTNEALLLDYLIENAGSKEEKLSLIENFLNNATFTFYRQTRFAEFEKLVHQKTESGEALTPEELCKIYGEMYQKYWGPDMVVDEEETYTWARIPHFYYNFYVYQYATGFAASQSLANQIKTKGAPAIEKYLAFLKAGSSDYPINVLKTAGVDMNSPEPIKAVINKMNEMMDLMEKLLAK